MTSGMLCLWAIAAMASMSGMSALDVTKRFNIDSAGVVLNGSLDLGQIMGVDKGRLHTERGQRVGQQVGGAAVDGFLRHNVPAVLGQCLKGVVDGSGAGGNGQRGNAALQSRDALFKTSSVELVRRP